MRHGVKIMGAYGMSETCPIVAASHVKPPGSGPADAMSDPVGVLTRTGFPIPLADAAIMGVDGSLLPPGRENIGGGPSPLARGGYLRDPERSAQLWRGGWLHTGDIAYRDRTDTSGMRTALKDVIKIGGEWFSTLELENALSPASRRLGSGGRRNSRSQSVGRAAHADVVLRPALRRR